MHAGLLVSIVAAATWFVPCGSTFAAAPQAEVPDKPAGDERTADVQEMQGRWEREITNPAGVKMRIVKEVVDLADTVTEYDAQGNITHAHASTFELAQHGPLKVFTIKSSVVTAGRNMGAQLNTPRSFVYRIEGDRMIEAWGLLDTDRGAPLVIVWRRVKADD